MEIEDRKHMTMLERGACCGSHKTIPLLYFIISTMSFIFGIFYIIMGFIIVFAVIPDYDAYIQTNCYFSSIKIIDYPCYSINNNLIVNSTCSVAQYNMYYIVDQQTIPIAYGLSCQDIRCRPQIVNFSINNSTS